VAAAAQVPIPTIGGISLLAAPILFAAAEILSPESGGDAAASLASFSQHRTALLASALLGLASTMVLIPAVAAVLHLIRRRGVIYAHIAACLIIYGLVTAHAALGGINIMFYEMTSPAMPRTAMLALGNELFHAHAIAGPILLGHYAFALGILLLGIGLWRSHAFAGWVGPCVVAWILTDIALGSAPVGHVLADVISNLFAIAAFSTIGWTLLTSTDATWDSVAIAPSPSPSVTYPAPAPG
jgi:hypothetical protein